MPITIEVCSECRSEDVERRMWVKVNEPLLDPEYISDELDDCWCNNCGSHTVLDKVEHP